MKLIDTQLAVETHRAVIHPLIKRLSHGPGDLRAWKTFAKCHHHIVKEFPYHIQTLFVRLPSDLAKTLHPVLADEFPPGALDDAHGVAPDFSAHAALQLALCHSLGIEPDKDPLPAIDDFIKWHREVALTSSFDFALGVFGPGHEYAVPVMFRQLVSGSPPWVNPKYLFEHLDIDVEHAKRFFEVLDSGQFDLNIVHDGAMRSLDYRARAWDAILEEIERGD